MNLELAEVVGHLSALRRFPVGQLGGEAPSIACINEQGLVGDRAYELYDAESGQRLGEGAWPALLLYDARYLDDLVREPSPDWVRIRKGSGGAEFPLADSVWRDEISSFLRRAVRVRRRPEADAPRYLRLLSRATLRFAERAYGVALESVLLRANLVIEITDANAFAEETLIGKRIRIGEALLEIVAPAAHCIAAVEVPGRTAGDVDLLRGLLQVRGGRVGVEARVVSGQRLRAGDPIVCVD